MKIKVVRVKRLPDWPAWAVMVGLLWLALVLAAVYLSIKSGKIVDLCLFKRLTHILCPTCGATREVLNVFKGNFWSAFLFNPLIFLAGFLFIIIGIIRFLFGRTIKINLSKIEKKIIWAALIVLLLINWAYLIVYVG